MLREKDGRSLSVREYKEVVGEHGNMVSMREKEYVRMKESQRNECFTDGSVGCKSMTDGKQRRSRSAFSVYEKASTLCKFRTKKVTK